MKIWKRSLALLMAGAMALSLFACAGDDPDASASPDVSPSASGSAAPSTDPDAAPSIDVDLSQGVLEFSAGLSASDVMLTVNGTDIPADLYLYMLAMTCSSMQQYLPYFGMTLEDVADTVLEESVSLSIYHALMRQKAAELGCLLTDAQHEEIRKQIEETDIEAIFPYWGLSDESFEFIFSMDHYYSNVLEAATHDPSPEELEDYLTSKGVFRVKHILLKTVDDSGELLADSAVSEKKIQAEDLLTQLQAAEDMPAKFDELMNAHSEDGRTEDGALAAPDGYVFDGESSLVGGFREAALELAEGGLSGIVETDYGYPIMLRLPLTDEDKAEWQSSFRPDALSQLLTQWQESSAIVRSDALSNLNVPDFYDRLAAYQQALDAQNAPAESAPVESGGVG